MAAEPRAIPTSREKTAQSQMEARGQGGRESAWAPIPSRLHPSKNADCRMRNAEWPNVEWPNQASADPHAVGDLYHLPGRRARLEPRLPADLGKMTHDQGPGCRLNAVVLALQAAVPGSAASPPRRRSRSGIVGSGFDNLLLTFAAAARVLPHRDMPRDAPPSPHFSTAAPSLPWSTDANLPQ